MISCGDSWDEHYKQEGGSDSGVEISGNNLLDFLSTKSEYSKFVDLLTTTGISEELSKNQVLTVWAINNDNMSEIPQDSTLRRNLALHHINSMALYSPKLEDGKLVKTLSGKNAVLAVSDDMITLDGHELVKPNQLCANGVIHEIDGMLDYKDNIYDVIVNSSNEYSMYKELLLGMNDTIFRPDLSFPIGNTPSGQIIYDSVFIIENPVFREADIRDENEKLTLFMPKDDQLKDAMQRISEFYGNNLTSYDSVFFLNWVLTASFHEGEIRNYEESESIYSVYKQDWRTDIQKVDPNFKEVSNGLVYDVTYLHIPRNLFTQTFSVIHNKQYKSLTSAQKEQYYKFIAYKTIGEINDCIYINYDKNGKDWETAYTVLQDDRELGVSPIQLPPGKYQLEMSFRAYMNCKHDVYVNGVRIAEKYKFDESPYETGNFKLRKIAQFEIKESDGISEVQIQIKLREITDAATGPRFVFYETKVSVIGEPIY